MATLKELRKQYPQYDDMNDMEFTDKFYNKYYSDIPKDEFYNKINFDPKKFKIRQQLEEAVLPSNLPLKALAGFGKAGQNIAQTAGQALGFEAPTSELLDYGRGGMPHAIGENLPYVLAGGMQAIPQMAAQGLAGFMNAPESSPLSRIAQGTLGAALTGIGGKAIPAVPDFIAKNLAAKKPAQEFMQNLVQSKELPTDIENIANLGKRLQFGKQSAIEESLIPKKKLFETEAEKNIYGNAPDEIRNMLLNYHNLDKKELSSLNDSVKNLLQRRSEYLHLKDVNKNYRSMGIDEAHEAFKTKPSLEHADQLLQKIGQSERELEGRIQKAREFGNKTAPYEIKLERLRRNKSALLGDLNNFFENLPKDKQNLYSEFRRIYRENVPKYNESGDVIRNLSQGDIGGMTREQVSRAFKGTPTEDIEKILSDIGPSGLNNIIYNRLISGGKTSTLNNPKSLAQAILNARQAGGYGHYITKEHEAFANDLLRRLQNQKIAKLIGGGLGIGALSGGLGHHLLSSGQPPLTGY